MSFAVLLAAKKFIITLLHPSAQEHEIRCCAFGGLWGETSFTFDFQLPFNSTFFKKKKPC